MKTVYPTKGIQLSQFYTPSAAFLAEFPDFSLDHPTSFFTEAYYVDNNIGLILPKSKSKRVDNDPSSKQEMDKNKEEKEEEKEKKSNDEKEEEEKKKESKDEKKKVDTVRINYLLVRTRHSTNRDERDLLVFAGRQNKEAFAAVHEKIGIADDHEWVNGICSHVQLETNKHEALIKTICTEDNAMCVYGVLRYVIADDIVLDRVLFHVPSMLSVPSHNQHNQFCIGTVCGADVVDVLTFKSHVVIGEDGKQSLHIRQPEAKFNLQESEPRLSKCMYRKHSPFDAFRYWTSNMHGKYYQLDKTLSDLRAPLASDFAALGLEEAYTHALANPPPKREHWQDFPIMKIVYCDENTRNKKAVQTEETKKVDAT